MIDIGYFFIPEVPAGISRDPGGDIRINRARATT
jgi:hypothetical protein